MTLCRRHRAGRGMGLCRCKYLACPTQSMEHVALHRRGGSGAKGGLLGRGCRAGVRGGRQVLGPQA